MPGRSPSTEDSTFLGHGGGPGLPDSAVLCRIAKIVVSGASPVVPAGSCIAAASSWTLPPLA
jgi:hypothetical protein